MVSYNLTELRAAQNPADLTTYANHSTRGLFMGLFVIALFFVLLYILKRWEFYKAILAASFATFIVSLICTLAGWLNFYITLVFLIMFALSALYAYTQNQ